MAAELDPLLNRLAAFAPHFGRLQGDIDAMVSRGRAQDFKGVMQNARLVLEALMRSLVTEELKQTPGKAMLDELITKFRQQANQGVVPTTILAHMGTVQAWGNLSSHDHAGSLQDAKVEVGLDEVVASLNSIVAVLGWFATKRGIVLDPAMRTPPVPTTQPGTSLPPVNQTAPQQLGVAPAPARGSSPLPIILGAVALVALLGIGFVATRGSSTPTPKDPKTPTVDVTPFSGLDALYASWKEPVPPASCRRVEDAPRLAAIATDITALGVVDPNPESSYLLARATFERERVRSPALDKALACPNFAAAENLAGRAALGAQDFDQARKFFLAAIAASPSFLNARYNLALMYIQSRDYESAKDKLDNLIAETPEFGEAYLLRAALVQLKGDAESAKKDACMAAKLGVEKAKAECAKLSGSP
ncbi:MAG: tetratricopeptide repeat protein [Myxococcales bacterium]|nr:tetratricopeptide repeat protein [Myxococcales bacterium]MDP3503096.1 tetratricopeptide repeat protein [Myxococcales bacterium]